MPETLAKDGNVFTKSAALWFLTELLVVLGIAMKPSPYKWLSILPPAALVYYQLKFTVIWLGGDITLQYALGTRLFSLMAFAIYYIFLKDAQREIRYIGGGKENEKTGSMAERAFLHRVWLSACLLHNPRAVGWSHEPLGRLPPRPTPKSRFAFIASQFVLMVQDFIVYDIALTLVHINPYFDKNVLPEDITGYGRLWRLGMGAYLLMIYGILSAEHTMLSIVWVGLGISEPQYWPRLFASLSEGYTLRRFWGIAWHQQFRLVFNAPAEYLAEVLHLPKKSKFTTYFKIFAVFLISGLMHQCGDYAIMGRTWSQSTSTQSFILHAFGIMLEDGVLALARRAGLKETRLTRLIGYVWVVVWFAFSIPYWTDPPAQIGVMTDGIGEVYKWVLRRLK